MASPSSPSLLALPPRLSPFLPVPRPFLLPRLSSSSPSPLLRPAAQTDHFGHDFAPSERYTAHPINLRDGSPTNPYINPSTLYAGWTSWRFGPNVVGWEWHVYWLVLNYLMLAWAFVTMRLTRTAYLSRIDKVAIHELPISPYNLHLHLIHHYLHPISHDLPMISPDLQGLHSEWPPSPPLPFTAGPSPRIHRSSPTAPPSGDASISTSGHSSTKPSSASQSGSNAST